MSKAKVEAPEATVEAPTGAPEAVDTLAAALTKNGRKNGKSNDLRMYLVIKDTDTAKNATVVKAALDKVGVKPGGYAAYLAKALLNQLKHDLNGK